MENDKLKLLIAKYRLALTAIAKDENLECKCGCYLYENGEYCPKCIASFALNDGQGGKI